MDDFLKMDIFFAATTLAVLVFTVLMSVFLVYAIRVARTLDRISSTIEKETKAITKDLGEVRAIAKREAGQYLLMIDTARKALMRLIAPKKTRGH